MKSINETEYEEIQVELKYCERCGGLWLRPRLTEGVYCTPCRVHWEARLSSGEEERIDRRRRKRGQSGLNLRRSESIGSRRIDYLEGVATRGVTA